MSVRLYAGDFLKKFCATWSVTHGKFVKVISFLLKFLKVRVCPINVAVFLKKIALLILVERFFQFISFNSHENSPALKLEKPLFVIFECIWRVFS